MDRVAATGEFVHSEFSTVEGSGVGKARLWLEALKARHAKLKDELAAIEPLIQSLESALDLLGEEALSSALHSHVFPYLDVGEAAEPRKAKRSRGILRPDEIADQAASVLAQYGRPMTRSEIVAELDKRGVPISGKDRNKNLGTILWREKSRFVHLGHLGYWLRDRPLEGVYDPA